MQAVSTAIAAAISINQGSCISAANVAAFASSNATAIAAAKASANDTARPGVNCLDYTSAYADAVTTVLQNNQTSAAATAIAAGFAQGCAVTQATGLAITEAIYSMGCNNGVGAALLSESHKLSCKCCILCLYLHAYAVHTYTAVCIHSKTLTV